MKYILSLFIVLTTGVQAQQNKPMIKTESKVYYLDPPSDHGKTSNTAVLKGVTYPVYVDNHGREFIFIRSDKSHKLYRRYIPDSIAHQPRVLQPSADDGVHDVNGK
jgi:hypothetical protein